MSKQVSFEEGAKVSARMTNITLEDGKTVHLKTLKEMKKPKYEPMLAHKVHRGKCYASGIVSSQETMMANLRYIRQQLDKEDKELEQMARALKSDVRRYTPYHNVPRSEALQQYGYDVDPNKDYYV